MNEKQFNVDDSPEEKRTRATAALQEQYKATQRQ